MISLILARPQKGQDYAVKFRVVEDNRRQLQRLEAEQNAAVLRETLPEVSIFLLPQLGNVEEVACFIVDVTE